MNKLLASASALALTVAFAASAQAADQDAILLHDVGPNNSVDLGEVRNNDISTGTANNVDGVLHIQQNNGANNAMGVAANVSANGDVDQFVLLKQRVENNSATESVVHPIQRDNNISGSLNGGSGRYAVQQNNGDANAIGANFAVMADLDGADGDSSQKVIVKQKVKYNYTNHIDSNGDVDRLNTIDGSLNNFSGSATVQQNNGNANAIGSASAVATAGSSDADVEQTVVLLGVTRGNVAGNESGLFDFMTERDNVINNSGNGLSGMATIQQNNGDVNVMGVGNAILVTEDTGDDHDVDQAVIVLGKTDNREIIAIEGHRDNDLTNSFNRAEGILTVQQNNGTANVIQTGNAVAVNTGESDVDQLVVVAGSVSNYRRGTRLIDDNNERFNTTANSFNNAAGVITVQQNNGDHNVMGVGHAVAAFEDNGSDGSVDDTDQGVIVGGIITNIVTSDNNDPERPQSLDIDGERLNDVTDSFNGAEGIISVQQNNGNGNIIGAGVAVRADFGTSEDDGSGEDNRALAAAGGAIIHADSNNSSFAGPPAPFDAANTVENSFNNSAGVITVQQNNGDSNVLSQAVTVAANIESEEDIDDVEPAVALTGGVVAGNVAVDGSDRPLDGTNKSNEITNSFVNAEGVVDVQQNNGNNNVISAATAVQANIDTADSSHDDVRNFAAAGAFVHANEAFADGVTDRINSINSNSFRNGAGIATVQQNNGDNNVMGASTSVVASLGGDFDGIVSDTLLAAAVSFNSSFSEATLVGPGRVNEITGSLQGYQGVMTVQQNNGNNNAIQSVVAVTANLP